MLFSLIRAIRIFEQFELQINTESRVKNRWVARWKIDTSSYVACNWAREKMKSISSLIFEKAASNKLLDEIHLARTEMN